MLDGITVDYYGTQTPLNQLANLSVRRPTLIVAQPYDPSQIGGHREGHPHVGPRPESV